MKGFGFQNTGGGGAQVNENLVLYRVVVTINKAEMNALATTPKLAIPAVAGKRIDVISMIGKYVFNGVAYAASNIHVKDIVNGAVYASFATFFADYSSDIDATAIIKANSDAIAQNRDYYLAGTVDAAGGGAGSLHTIEIVYRLSSL